MGMIRLSRPQTSGAGVHAHPDPRPQQQAYDKVLALALLPAPPNFAPGLLPGLLLGFPPVLGSALASVLGLAGFGFGFFTRGAGSSFQSTGGVDLGAGFSARSGVCLGADLSCGADFLGKGFRPPLGPDPSDPPRLGSPLTWLRIAPSSNFISEPMAARNAGTLLSSTCT